MAKYKIKLPGYQPRRIGMERAQIRINNAFVYYPVIMTAHEPYELGNDIRIWAASGIVYYEIDEGKRSKVYKNAIVELEPLWVEPRWAEPMLFSFY